MVLFEILECLMDVCFVIRGIVVWVIGCFGIKELEKWFDVLDEILVKELEEVVINELEYV